MTGLLEASGDCFFLEDKLYCTLMSQSELINKDAIRIYLDGDREAIRTARFNFNGGFYGVAVNRAYYAFFYVATAILLTLDLTRSKHSGVLAAFREHFVKTDLFPIEDSRAYGEAFELRNLTDYEMLGQADETQAQAVIEKANRFLERGQTYLAGLGY